MWTCPKCNREFKNTNQSHYCTNPPQTVDEYIQHAESENQKILVQIRKVIHKASPNVTEKIAWSMPFFTANNNHISISAHKNHIGFFVGNEAGAVFKSKLVGLDLKINKGLIHIPWNDVPYDLISELAKFCLGDSK